MYAQAISNDDTTKWLNEVIVTSTRTASKLANVAVPVQVISQKTIKQSGALRLKDILQEQAGLSITNGFGAGIQMQGLNPDYTLILINGEPLVGRTAGVLDINRISIGNIKKIEIVKGPSSSLYGSEAMAGVINIITEEPTKQSLETSIRVGFGNPDKGWISPVEALVDKDAFKSTDINLDGATKIKNTSIRYTGNAYYVDGVSYRPYSTLRVPQPIWRITNQVQLNTKIDEKTQFGLFVRQGYDHIKQEFSVGNNGGINNTYGRETNYDVNFNPSIVRQFNKNIKSTLRYYQTLFVGSQKLFFNEKPDSSYVDEFRQHFYRLENQTEINFQNNRLSIGGGYTIDDANSTRYDNINNRKRNTISYAFVQNEWTPSPKLTLIAGARYDHNKLFAAALSPKLAFRYNPNRKLHFKASIGRGFKAPDFRQLYLNFTNNAAGGYSVLGTIDAIKTINQLNTQGLISDLKSDFYKLNTLTPEFSTGINIGGGYILSNKLQFQFNYFLNEIKDMIDYRQVATKTNGAQIFSYINVKNAYTQGIEAEVTWNPYNKLNITSGYQYLVSEDLDDLKNISSRKVFTRNPDGTSRVMTADEYRGLPNRSKHLYNVKFFYEPTDRIFITLRVMYKSNWYVSDRDGNGLINSNDESARGYFLTNVSAGKKLGKTTTLMMGIDNLTNYKDVIYLPNLQGRMIFCSVNIKLK